MKYMQSKWYETVNTLLAKQKGTGEAIQKIAAPKVLPQKATSALSMPFTTC